MDKIKVLLAEDDVSMVDLYTKAFEFSGYEIKSAANGEEALSVIRENKFKPDMILLDFMMPKMNGMDVLRRLKQDQEFEYAKNVPVIMLTNLASLKNPDDLKTAISLGAASYLIKSQYDPKEVVSKVGEILKNHN